MTRTRAVVLSVLTPSLIVLLAACNQAAPRPDFGMTLSPWTLNAGLADSPTTTVQLTSQNNFAGTVTLRLFDSNGNPANDVSVSPASVTLAAGQSASTPLKITATASLPAGTFSFTLSASGGSVTHTNPLTLVLSNNGTGTFATATPFTAGNSPWSVAVGDFNGDGRPDLTTANNADGTVSVLLGDGRGGFTPATNSPFTVGSKPQSVAVGDFNGDGNLDLATANYHDGTVSVLLGDGRGGFTPATNSPFTVG
ncbi:MAG: VCBS repeat-containing protein, partial [Deinococcales bacterium]